MFKFSKTILAGALVAAAFTIPSFADTVDTKPPEPDTCTYETTVAPDSSVQAAVSDALLQKQDALNKALFDTYAKELAAAGITVTHTAPVGETVEIGITPYSKENSDFVVKLVGTDSVNIVEGQQAVLLDGEEAQLYSGTAADDGIMTVTAAEDVKTVSANTETQKKPFPAEAAWYCVGVIILGGFFVAIRSKKGTKSSR